jgi:hypothetical protein
MALGAEVHFALLVNPLASRYPLSSLLLLLLGEPETTLEGVTLPGTPLWHRRADMLELLRSYCCCGMCLILWLTVHRFRRV